MTTSSQSSNSSLPKSVIITGASSGIGEAAIELLQGHGFRVFPTVRKEADAEKIRKVLNSPDDVCFLDVTKQDSIDQFYEDLKAKLNGDPLYALVNNAGLAVPGPMELVTPDDWRMQLEVNLVGQVALTQKMLPLLRESKGRIINISSLSGIFSTPFMSAYCASKFGLEACSDAMRIELKPFGIKTVLVEPGKIKTKIFDKAHGGIERLEAKTDPTLLKIYDRHFIGARNTVENANDVGITTETAAKVILKTLTVKNPKARYRVGWDAFASIFGKWLLPDFVLDKVVEWGFESAIAGRPIG